MKEMDVFGLTLRISESDPEFNISTLDWSVTFSEGWVDNQENLFVATRKIIGFLAHLKFHMDLDEVELETQTCDENHATPDLTQAYEFFKARNSNESSIGNNYYNKIYMMLSTDS